MNIEPEDIIQVYLIVRGNLDQVTNLLVGVLVHKLDSKYQVPTTLYKFLVAHEQMNKFK